MQPVSLATRHLRYGNLASLRWVLDVLPLPTALVEPSGTLLHCSPSMIDLWPILEKCWRDRALVCVPRDGLKAWVRLHARDCAFDGKPAVLLTATDATHECQHAETSAILDLLAQVVPPLIWIGDPSGNYVHLTHAWEELLGPGRDLDVHVHPEDAERRSAVRQEALERRQAYRIEYRLKRVDNRCAWLLEHATPRALPDGTFGGLIGTCLDFTERRERDEALHAQRRLVSLGQLAGGVTHDFNNILTVIIGYASLLEEQVPPDLKEPVGEILKAADMASAMTQRLLAISRSHPLKAELIDVNVVVSRLLPILRQAVGQGAALVPLLSSDPAVVRADSGQIEQVLLNLVVNSRDAIGDGGEIRIAVESQAETVTLCVADNGVGMDEATRAQMFEPFFTTKEPGRGTGLGLATVQSIVLQHEGSLHVESAPFHGTAITIQLPRKQPARVTASDSSESEVRTGILLVEDHPVVRVSTTQILTRAGFTVFSADCPSVAEQLFAQHQDQIDLVLSDVHLPECDGPTLVSRLRKRRPALPVLYMSGNALGVSLDQSDARFIAKPFSAETLIREVRATLLVCRKAAKRADSTWNAKTASA